MPPINTLPHTPHDDFAGHVTPEICWQALCDNENAYLIDVRTNPEWAFVGTPDITPTRGTLLFVEWQSFPTMQENQNFTQDVAEKVADKSAPLFFLCRSGVRSQAAARAMTQAGFAHCYNVAGGFEGDADAHHQRGKVNGWKVAGCLWAQK